MIKENVLKSPGIQSSNLISTGRGGSWTREKITASIKAHHPMANCK